MHCFSHHHRRPRTQKTEETTPRCPRWDTHSNIHGARFSTGVWKQLWVEFLRYILLLQCAITVLVTVFFFRGSTYIPCCCCCYCQRYGAVGKLPWLLMRRCGRGSSPTPQCRTLHSDKLPRRSGLGFALREKGVERQVQTPKQLVGAT